ncbi:hypothetical protein CEUSTIGMA_g8778.t1 [Chlamydomonas eustigma]|uniref:Uncharacterized protein n=1 Tax=Chlamydomonas eustigma TaxID=1157962 RepID=A0A250XE34_9CHLO|nr:hypothetical protein CEUSTIGMA_g8778.t1 [Chlamydomonas eustigma]|eukprot:GAX81347.1 hypothetical protein CEUSTIGMA_g8778.t1 [Chlamydomonas eustigma]
MSAGAQIPLLLLGNNDAKTDIDVLQWGLRVRSAPPTRVHMARPFGSLSDAALQSRPDGVTQQKQVPKLVGTRKETANKSDRPQERILISEVEITGADADLKKLAMNTIKTRPNFAYTLDEVKKDVERVFNTGWFRECVPDAVDTRDGVKLIIKVVPNEELKGMVMTGANILPNNVIDNALHDMQGKTMNFVSVKRAIKKLDSWYSDQGIVGQVTDFDFKEGILRIQCAEAVVGSIDLQFIDPQTQLPREKPRTRPEIIRRHLQTEPGKVYSLTQAKRDIASIYSTGLFEDVSIAPKEAEDSTETHPKIDLTLNLLERKTGGMGAGGGLSAQATAEGGMPGFVGSFSYSEKNLFGLNHRLSARAELGQIDKNFQVVYTDPWLWGDKHRTSRTISLMNTRTSGFVVLGRPAPETAAAAGTTANGLGAGPVSSTSASSDTVLLSRLTGGVEYQRPLSATWSGTLGAHVQRTSCINEHGIKLNTDCYGAPLTCSGHPEDKQLLTSMSTSYGNPEDDSQLLFSLDQSVPFLQRDWLRFTRFRLRVDKPIPLPGPFTWLLKAKGGHVQGDLPPYEAFPIGGTNSVRGYSEGSVGSGRSWIECTSELRFPVMSAVSGCLFFDYGSDLGSGASVIGNPAGIREKPGWGYGYGGGVRMDTPVGPLRLEYAWNAKHVGRFHVGVGYD